MLELAVLLAFGALANEPATPTMFRDSGRVEVTDSGMMIVRAPQSHVLVARITDGELSTECATDAGTVTALLAEESSKKK
jgi:hypothetical protein